MLSYQNHLCNISTIERRTMHKKSNIYILTERPSARAPVVFDRFSAKIFPCRARYRPKMNKKRICVIANGSFAPVKPTTAKPRPIATAVL